MTNAVKYHRLVIASGFLFLLAVCLPGSVEAQPRWRTGDGIDTTSSGHIKLRGNYRTWPDDSLLRQELGANSSDTSADLRLVFTAQPSTGQSFLGYTPVGELQRWSINADYQLIAIDRDGENGQLVTSLSALQDFPAVDDSTRLWDLTHSFSDNNDGTILHRLDRLNVKYSGDRLVLQLGRQVISWGNGLLYNPVDIFNPFDPAAIDKEYKPGDDMLYAQYLMETGDDLQAVWVLRRDVQSGSANSDVASFALKYHGFSGSLEYDVLAARHFDESMFAVGLASDMRGATWRGDAVFVDSEDGNRFSLVSNLAYSWMQWGKNVSGIVEYYYNGFGLAGSDHSLQELQARRGLLRRIERGELFSIGRHYIAASATIELNPLWLVTPAVFMNAADTSALWQLSTSYDVAQNLQLLAALNLPSGSSGTEFGGIRSGVEAQDLSQGAGFFAQLGWYF